MTVCGIVDGHGSNGHWASYWATQIALAISLSEACSNETLPSEFLINKIFHCVNEGLKECSERHSIDFSLSGTSLCLCFLHHEQERVVAAWVGQSRCIAGRCTERDSGEPVVKSLTIDVDQRREPVANPNTIKNKGTLGDFEVDQFGVDRKPNIKATNLYGEDFLICCSDGVWEYVSGEEACQIVAEFGRAHAHEAAEALLRFVREQWDEDDDETADTSAIIIWP